MSTYVTIGSVVEYEIEILDLTEQNYIKTCSICRRLDRKKIHKMALFNVPTSVVLQRRFINIDVT